MRSSISASFCIIALIAFETASCGGNSTGDGDKYTITSGTYRVIQNENDWEKDTCIWGIDVYSFEGEAEVTVSENQLTIEIPGMDLVTTTITDQLTFSGTLEDETEQHSVTCFVILEKKFEGVIVDNDKFDVKTTTDGKKSTGSTDCTGLVYDEWELPCQEICTTHFAKK